MSKKRGFRAIFFLPFLPMLLLAGMALLFIPKKSITQPFFPPMPVDTAGYNLIGNLPENLESGGFMAGQNGWIYFTNFFDGGSLYMCRENGADMTKITDFPVCNINVLGTSVVFTGFEHSAFNESGHHAFSTGTDPEILYGRSLSPLEIWRRLRNDGALFGGKLYAVYGIHSASKPRFSVIDPDTTYFLPYLDRDGLSVISIEGRRNALANQFNGAKMFVTREKEYIVKKFSHGSTIYADLADAAGEESRIMRIDAKTLFPLDYINGGSLYRVGNGFVFHGVDGFVYEMLPTDNEIRPISAEPVKSFIMNSFGEIIADTDSGGIIISKEQRYSRIAETLLSRIKSKPITMQNGWYSYSNADSQYDYVIYFSASGRYYSLGDSGWSADWLNAKLESEPLVSLADLIVEDSFTPTWQDFSGDIEPIDPAGGDDFGSERPARPDADSRADAANDAQHALDAAVMLLFEDERIADKYTGESVEKLRGLYGGAFETALADAASKLSANLSRRFGMDVSIQEAREILAIWLHNTSYEVGGIEVASNGKEAGVLLAVKNPVDMSLLYDIITEAGDAEFSYVEMMREPGRHGFMSSLPENASAQIYMRMVNDDCWIAESPDKLIHIFIQGLD